MQLSTRKLVTIAMLCGLAMILSTYIRFPIIPAVGFLSYEPKDVILVITGFIYGPMAAFISTTITAILEIMVHGGNIIDVIMDVISSGLFACIAAYVYKKNHTQKGAIIGLSIGVVLMIISMLIWNYIVTPIYLGMPRDAVVAILLPGILPFNLIKASLNAVLVMLLYKPVVEVLRRTSLLPKSEHKNKFGAGYIIMMLFLLVTIILTILGYQGVI